MKRCELIRNIASVVTLGAVGTAIFAGSLGVIDTKETIIVLGASFASGIVSFIMDKIANANAKS
ncbi:hypothetical protein KNT65_gp284 [Escherichia phage EcS1]|uniref:Holin n=1 Tax=Escherichia phage EcS1 TaxID=2083276 RepID=A0A2Z5ZC52_9CAUD|nr:hypothetical protein KNT65_gp284 [Escherichia phage EcS1]BBC78209.1 Hypothetical protein [Escherichia phage EcS1]